MGSQSDDKTRESASANRKSHVVEDQCGHRLWKDTIKTLKLSIMKTGIFRMTDEQEQRLRKLIETGGNEPCADLDDDPEFLDDSKGFDPYNSTKK